MEYSFNNKSIGNNIIYSETVQIFFELITNLCMVIILQEENEGKAE
jgi:hypothetical protein